MEIGELVTVPMPDQTDDATCPFAHEPPKAELKNQLGGVGSILGTNMGSGKGVHTATPPTGGDYLKGSPEPDPRTRTAGRSVKFVTIKVDSQTVRLDDEPLPYPVTCAAHHLIPAQEALKGSPILDFMCKKGEDQDFRNSSKAAPAAVASSRVWGNVAYNVNGLQNGVWLPGNYAVGGGRGGVDVWKSKTGEKRKLSATDTAAAWIDALDLTDEEWQHLSTPDPNEEEGPQPGESLRTALQSAGDSKFTLAGKNFSITDKNPKWAYVKAAMDATDGQFHDRHEPYSKEVKKYLKKIAEAYERMYDRSTLESPCDDCRKAARPAGADAKTVGPPYNIVARLVAGSEFFKRFVNAKFVTARNIYTSEWVNAWIQSKDQPTAKKQKQ